MPAIVISLGALVAIVILARLGWRSPHPHEVLVITGRRQRLVRDGGAAVLPGFTRVQRVSLATCQADVTVEALSSQALPVRVVLTVCWQLDGTDEGVRRASRRSLADGSDAVLYVDRAVAAASRAVLGTTALEDTAGRRPALTEQIATLTAAALAPMGVAVTAVRLGALEDQAGYLADLARPARAEAARQARVAEAEAEQRATEAEQRSLLARAQARRDTELARAAFDGEVDRAASRARFAGPLEAARARQEALDATEGEQ